MRLAMETTGERQSEKSGLAARHGGGGGGGGDDDNDD